MFTITKAGIKENHVCTKSGHKPNVFWDSISKNGSISTFFQCLSPLEYLAPSSEVLVFGHGVIMPDRSLVQSGFL